MKVLCLIIVAGFCLFSGLQAQEDFIIPKKRYQVWVLPVQKEPVRVGLLYEIKDSSVVVSSSLHKADYPVGRFGLSGMGVENIKLIKIRREGVMTKGMVIGGIIGAAAGVTAGLLLYDDADSELGNGIQAFGITLIAVGCTGAGIGIGMAATGFKVNIPINGRQEQFAAQKTRLKKYSMEFNSGGRPPASRMPGRSAYSVADIDGNRYEVVISGGLMWMAENLRVTHYANGDPVPEITGKAEWSATVAGACCNPGNDPAKAALYGKLYNRAAVSDPRNLCPEGWHVPSAEEWGSLIDSLGGPGNAGGLLSDNDIPRWSKINKGKNLYYPFVRMAGTRDRNGEFTPPGATAQFWWAKAGGQEIVFGILVQHKLSGIGYVSRDAGENAGMSVRCVKNTEQ